MQVVSNYPQIPIATSNPATDVARAENLQRPPVIPPQQASSNHEERSLNSQNERANVNAQQQAKLADTVHERQQSNQQQQQDQSSQDQRQQQSKSQLLQLFTPAKPALDRRDIRNRVATTETANSTTSQQTDSREPSSDAQATTQQQSFYREFGQRIGSFYYDRSHPEQESALTASA